MSSTINVELDRKKWVKIANKAGIVTTQLQTSIGSVSFYAGQSAPSEDRETPAITLTAQNQLPTFSEKAEVWARGSGTLTVMTIDV
ncbi:hypothetical protein KYLE_20 [Pantoea phage Kyle]|uniref:Uncharacterized protein n=1 Tax=Pantoea phage Kyle TaxID=2589665 RepID=A0A514A8P1_9CAUD|nr:hypothetical protein HWC52_gp020 [Pantoea phage Kyle]QDH49641.1 hypothetical protein KYLE_20 [Pantoea phage Kyle]